MKAYERRTKADGWLEAEAEGGQGGREERGRCLAGEMGIEPCRSY